jgi:hypothetical protein
VSPVTVSRKEIVDEVVLLTATKYLPDELNAPDQYNSRDAAAARISIGRHDRLARWIVRQPVFALIGRIDSELDSADAVR